MKCEEILQGLAKTFEDQFNIHLAKRNDISSLEKQQPLPVRMEGAPFKDIMVELLRIL